MPRGCAPITERTASAFLDALLRLNALDDALGAEAGFGFREVVLDGALGSNPVDVAADALFDGDRGLVADGAYPTYVGDERSDLAGTELSAGKRADVDAELAGDDASEVANAGRAAGAGVDGKAVELVGLATRRLARAMSSTKQRSRVWPPSSYMTGGC